MHRALPIAVVALVLLAGCGGLLGADRPDTTSPTPANVPTDSPFVNPPNGLTEERLDPLVLTATHTEALDNTSFTVTYAETLTAENGTSLLNSTTTTRVAANHSVARSTSLYEAGTSFWFDQPVSEVDQWFDGTTYYFRATGPDGPLYFSPSVVAGTPDGIPSSTLQSYYVNAEETAISTQNGKVFVELTGVPGDQLAGRIPVDVTEQTVTVTMSAEGRVEEYRIEYTGYLFGSPDTVVTGTHLAQFGEFGATTVDVPGWVDEARTAIRTD